MHLQLCTKIIRAGKKLRFDTIIHLIAMKRQKKYKNNEIIKEEEEEEEEEEVEELYSIARIFI